MLNTKDSILQRLKSLGLSSDEARLYLELLKEPSTHLKLARGTGINRSKVYRLADQLEKRSLISARSDDRGTFLIAADPATLEVELIAQEGHIKSQRQAFNALLPALNSMRKKDTSNFVVHTYEGVEGFKQMLWHELKAKGEELVFGCGTVEDLVQSPRWSGDYLQKMAESGYSLRVISNPREIEALKRIDPNSRAQYEFRMISVDILPLDNQIAIYNDTVSIYNWKQEQKVGLEIVDKGFAKTMRLMFEAYWKIAAKNI